MASRYVQHIINKELLLVLMYLISILGISCCNNTGIVGQTDASNDLNGEMDSITDLVLDNIGDSTDVQNDHLDITDIYEIDVVSTDSITDYPFGICSIIEQLGCPEEAWCEWALDEVTCTIIATCIARPTGTLDTGEECYPPSEESICKPGTMCWRDDSELRVFRCHEWCRDDYDCSLPGSRCLVSSGYTPGYGACTGIYIEYPLSLCYLD